jgi:hypothetical protein
VIYTIVIVVLICATALRLQNRVHHFKAQEYAVDRKVLVDKTDSRINLLTEQLAATQRAVKKIATLAVDNSAKQGIKVAHSDLVSELK